MLPKHVPRLTEKVQGLKMVGARAAVTANKEPVSQCDKEKEAYSNSAAATVPKTHAEAESRGTGKRHTQSDSDDESIAVKHTTNKAHCKRKRAKTRAANDRNREQHG